jgi:transposase-like protein
VRFDHNGTETDRGAERVRWVAEYRASGLGLKQFAHENGLKASQLHYWVYGAGRKRVAQDAKPVFREVLIPSALSMAPAWSAEIALPDGTRVLLSPGTDVAWVSTLVESLRQPCSP